MKKHLFFGAAFLIAAGAFSQTGKLAKPSGIAENQLKKYDREESTSLQQSSSAFTGSAKKIKRLTNSNAKTSAVSAILFTGSMNVNGYLVSNQKPLTYSKGIDAVSFIARKSTSYTASSNSNSGTIVGLYSTNLGTTWNETCIWANANNLARYPQGGIYNPLGNTNINNAYLVGTGPFTSAAGGWGGATNGHWYTSKQITTPGNTTPGSDMQSSYYTSGILKSHYMSRNSFSSIEGGLVRSMANIVNDPAGTTNAAFGLRGHLMVKGTFNAGSFVWSVDSFIPPVNARTDLSKLIGMTTPIQAWNDAGTIGYVVTLGSRLGATTAMSGYQPIVWMTSNSGASWSLLPANDFADAVNFKGVYDRLDPIATNTAVIACNFQGSEGIDAAVDINGQLHIASMTYGHTKIHVDSLGYRYVFGTEQYSYREDGPFDYPVIYDFYTKSTGGWDYHMVDSMGTEGPSGTTGQPGYATNPWITNTAGTKEDLDARIQVSRTDDGSKIFYAWGESDSMVTSSKWNLYPDIKMKGFDVVAKKVTPRMNITTGVTNADQQAYFFYMSNRAAGSSSACVSIPFTITWNSANNGDNQVDTYYLSGVQGCASNFSINPMSPKGLGAGINTATTVNYDVMNFPNPADKATTIVVALKEATNFEVVLYNSIGQLMDTYKVNGHVGGNDINIDLSNFKSGIYFYNVKVGSSVVTKKLVIQ